MNPMIQKYVDDEFMTEAEGQFIENAIMNKESVVVSGDRSAGVRPLYANLMAVAKKNFSAVQAKTADKVDDSAEFILIPASEEIENTVAAAIAIDSVAFITLKEPENPLSLMKLLKNNFKKGNKAAVGKVIHTVECRKVDGEPKLTKITDMVLTEDGKVQKTDFEG